MTLAGVQMRTTYQKIKDSAQHCCVPKCRCCSRYNFNISFHCFPVSDVVRRQWIANIRRENFTPSKDTRVCSRHFLPGDIVKTPLGKRRVKRGAIPALFEWNNYSINSPRATARESSRPQFESPVAADPAEEPSETEIEFVSPSPDHDYCASLTTGEKAELHMENEDLRTKLDLLRHQVEELQLRTRFCLGRFAASDQDIRLYTRFASYQHFQYFWKLIESAVKTSMFPVTNTKPSTAGSDGLDTSMKLSPIDELFLFLMYLSLGLPLRELAERFGILQSSVSRILRKWTNFLYHLLGSKRLWLPREVVRAHLPPEFASFPDTQVVLHCTEIYCQTPPDLRLQSDVFSIHKSHSTLKAMIGLAPHGAVTFVSGLYAGSTSDRVIFKQSGVVNALQPDMAIMVDKRFPVGSLAPCKVHKVAFLSGKENPKDVLQTPSPLRVHVERCIRRVTENKLFDRVLPVSVCGSIDELFSVACYLVNYQNGPLMKA